MAYFSGFALHASAENQNESAKASPPKAQACRSLSSPGKEIDGGIGSFDCAERRKIATAIPIDIQRILYVTNFSEIIVRTSGK